MAEELLAQAQLRPRIAKTLVDTFQISLSTAYRRIADVEDEWARINITPEAKAVRKARLRAHYNAAIRAAHEARPPQIGAVVSALAGIAKLDGLEEPTQHDIHDTRKPHEQWSLDDLPESIRARITTTLNGKNGSHS